mgnify:CR=1 FL=1|tara:strand:+ start:855 stop:1172 length:318 start_codon:yes stop_codon:yes gene_type:complete
MSTSTIPIVKDQELALSGLVESASVNSIADFIPSEFSSAKKMEAKVKDDFVNIFICHLIFYAFYCVSLVIHIVIDLGLGDFIKKQIEKIKFLRSKNIFEKRPAFA